MSARLIDAFAQVSQAGPPMSAVRHVPVGSGIHVGLTPEGTRVLVVEVPKDASHHDDRSSRGVWLLGSPQLGGERVHVIECRDPRLDGVFTGLAGELVEMMDDRPKEDRPELLRRRLTEWRELFSPLSSRGMSRQEQVGLWGELVVLLRRLDAGVRDALDSWEGGLGRPGPDFRWAGKALEVKTTTSLEGFPLRVHGLGQLDPPPSGAALLLAGVKAVAEPDGQSLPEIVDELLDRVDRIDLLRRLSSRGYEHDPSADRDWLTLTLSDLRVWSITEDSPRLTASVLPGAWRDAITDVEYTIDTAAFGSPLEDTDQAWL